MSAATRRHLVLVGLMGAGKTTVGRVCAERLARPFTDTDDVVVAAAGASVADIFAAEGEPGFRARERLAVADVCASPTPLVIACGGGAPLDPDNRRLLHEHGVVVWLEAPPRVLAARVAGSDDRPLLAGDAPGALERLHALREPAYAAVAHVRVDTDGCTPDDVATRVLEQYEAQRHADQRSVS
ncbi:MAG TPA: shikimate kinase [Acidimicrobiia bacterium]|nr:shikimate kinase [Acidimicrobiia bacterium]